MGTTARRRRKNPVTHYKGHKIRQLGNDSYMADVTAHGKRTRKCFGTMKEAQTFIDLRKTEITNQGAAAFTLNERARRDAAEARKKLPAAVSLQACADFYLLHHPQAGGVTIDQLIERYLEAPGRRGRKAVKRREASQAGAAKRLRTFARSFGERPIQAVTRSDVENWLDSHGWEGVNRRHYIVQVRALFAFAVRRELTTINPTDKIDTPEVTDPEPDIMPVPDIRKLLNGAAAAEETQCLVPRLALSFFCGLRPEELSRLQWEQVSFENKLVTITGEVAKIPGHRRTVVIPNNAIKWLTPYRQESGGVWPFSPSTLHRKRASLQGRAKVEVPKNAGRHCFASYHLAMHGNQHETATQMGHRDSSLLHKQYKNTQTTNGKTITPAMAKQYFDLQPRKGKIIEITKGAA